jgi:hypothetical protein
MAFWSIPWGSNLTFPVGVGMCSYPTPGYGGAEWVLLPDGNLVDYLGNSPSWATGTNGHIYDTLCFQSDGNMVIYNSSDTCSGPVLWASNT